MTLFDRPMEKLPEAPFRDIVSGRMVYYWKAPSGRIFMARGAYSWFRVEIPLPNRFQDHLLDNCGTVDTQGESTQLSP